jgi:hypothetical protein
MVSHPLIFYYMRLIDLVYRSWLVPVSFQHKVEKLTPSN